MNSLKEYREPASSFRFAVTKLSQKLVDYVINQLCIELLNDQSDDCLGISTLAATFLQPGYCAARNACFMLWISAGGLSEMKGVSYIFLPTFGPPQGLYQTSPF
jgi:hypothetical protein